MNVTQIYNENCLDTMGRMPDCFVDLTVTSPPYDNLRKYNGYSFDFESIAKELFRVTKVGGVVVWVVADSCVNGGETLNSFKQALFFQSLGFNCYDTMIYHKNGCPMRGDISGYNQTYEFMFILTKSKPKTINLIYDRQNKSRTKTRQATNRGKDGAVNKQNIVTSKELGRRENVWSYNTGEDVGENKFHPAIFPEQLASDHIHSWSNEGDLVYDPFSGSGTTAKMAHLMKRNWIGSEISKEYTDLSNKRIAPYLTVKELF